MIFVTNWLILFLEDHSTQKNEEDDDEEEKVEDYDTWKNRVLNEAYEMIKRNKNDAT